MATAGGLEVHMELSHPPEVPEPEPIAPDSRSPVTVAVAPAREWRLPLRGLDPTIPLTGLMVVALLLGGVGAAVHRAASGRTASTIASLAAPAPSAGTAEVPPTASELPVAPAPSTSPAPVAPAPHLTAVPQEAYAVPADARATVDLPTAEKVFAALYPIRSRAVFTNDDATLALIETGAARDYDVARCHLGCPTPPIPPANVPHAFSAPPQRTYPAFFAARASRTDIDGRPMVEVLVFTRSSRAAPWLVALDDTADSINPTLEDGSTGLGIPVPGVGGPDPRSLPAVLAAYWQHWWEAGGPSPDNPFIETQWLEDRGKRIVSSHQDNANLHEQETRTYRSDGAAGVYVFRALANLVLSCGSIRIDSVYTPSPGAPPIVQPPDGSEFGPGLLPGRYSRVSTHVLEEACVLVAAGGKSAPFETELLTISIDATSAPV
jgi:hypothetical protein